jgi:glycosyltransferase involved in cell wall biosynthesis
MPTPKVSVVIPVYGVEPYIEKCVRSLFEQTLDSLEYIFVNDYTPDASMDIVNRVAQEYPRRKEQLVIINHPHNMGGAKARESGIKAATGEYIIHCDSDDWVDTHMYQDLYEKAKREELDCLICSAVYQTDGTNHQKLQQNVPHEKFAFVEALLYCKTPVALYSFLVKREIYQSPEMMLPICHMMEDRVYSLEIICLTRNYGYTDTPYYYYRMRPDSICGDVSEKNLLNSFSQGWENMALIESFLSKRGLREQYQGPLSYSRFFTITWLLLPLVKQNNSYHSLFAKYFFSVRPSLLRSNRISFTIKLVCILISLGLYPLYPHRSEK